jgi:acyl-coenzyme A thioesterase PaaI-like protein
MTGYGTGGQIAITAPHLRVILPLSEEAYEPTQNIKSRPLPLARLKGITFTHAEPDKVIARMVVRPDLCTLGHKIHGGSAMAFADTTGGVATLINE